jgi:hypothetical protein
VTTAVRPLPVSVTLAETVVTLPRLSDAASALKKFTARVSAFLAVNDIAARLVADRTAASASASSTALVRFARL